jgi:hypothetical protein
VTSIQKMELLSRWWRISSGMCTKQRRHKANKEDLTNIKLRRTINKWPSVSKVYLIFQLRSMTRKSKLWTSCLLYTLLTVFSLALARTICHGYFQSNTCGEVMSAVPLSWPKYSLCGFSIKLNILIYLSIFFFINFSFVLSYFNCFKNHLANIYLILFLSIFKCWRYSNRSACLSLQKNI